jgi:uncharacterized surface protein with fasciclin (FAS1) repeats
MNLLERSPKIFKQIVASAAVLATVVGCSSDADFPTPSQNVVEIASTTERFSTLTAAVVAAGLAETLSEAELTLFAPNNDAFDALGLSEEELANLLADTETLTAILANHVIAGPGIDANTAVTVAGSEDNIQDTFGGGEVALSVSTEAGENVLYVDTSAVIATNIRATNGIIHEVDKVILPASPDVTNASSTITEIVVASADAGEFTILLAAVQQLGLADALAGGSLTVFAPTDAAFEALLAELGITAADLLASDILLPTVTQHVLGFEAQSVAAYAANGADLGTLNAAALLPIRIEGGALKAGNANVTTTDIIASNGVIHVVDAVITEVVAVP